ncbi:MAG: PAS domain S-box protein [Magnetococcus sp. DMHC-1]
MTSLIALALVAWFLGVFVNKLERDSLLHMGENQNITLTKVFSNTLWPSLKGFLQQSTMLTEEELRKHPLIPYLNQLIGKLMGNLEVVHIRIYNQDGMAIYSTDATQIGRDQRTSKGFIAGMEGRVTTHFVPHRWFGTQNDIIDGRDMIVSHVPLQQEREIHGVIELHYDLTPLLQHLSETQRDLAMGVGALFVALYLVLYAIIRRAAQIIREQHVRLEKYVIEVQQINETLEQRVEERTETLKMTNKVLKEEILDRQMAEAELRKLSRAVEQSPVSVIITNTDGSIEYVNPKFSLVTGYTHAEVIGKNPNILKSGEMSPEIYAEMWETLNRGGEWRGEILNRRKNGEHFWELASISPIRGKDGRVTHFVAVKEDITELKHATESLRISEARLRTIMENVVEGIVTTDANLIVESANPAMTALFGLSMEQLLGQSILQLIPSPHRERHAGYLQIYWDLDTRSRKYGHHDLRGELFVDKQVTGKRQDDTVFPMELSVSHVRTGGRSQFIATMRDISERKKAEKTLDEARRLNYQQEKMASIGTLAAGIIHEINNPITAIIGLLDSLQDVSDQLDAENRSLLTLVNEQIQRLTDITRDIAEFSMPQNEERQLLDLNSLVERSSRFMRFDKRLRKIRLRLDPDRDLPAVAASGSQLQQVLINLIANAADALDTVTDREREIVVSTRREGRAVRLEVADNGCGMDAKTRERAFDAFFTTKPFGKGTGLGLSLCYSIIARHGGHMFIESSLGQGARIGALLPLVEIGDS